MQGSAHLLHLCIGNHLYMVLGLFPLGNICPVGMDYTFKSFQIDAQSITLLANQSSDKIIKLKTLPYQLMIVQQCCRRTYMYQADRDARTRNPPDNTRLGQDQFVLSYK